MKQFLLLPGAALLLMTAALPATAETVNISTPNTSLVLDAEKGGKLRILHYGNRLSDADIATHSDAGAIKRDAYPVYGIYPQAEAAMSVTHADGNRTTDTEVTGITSRKDADGADVTTIAMRDKVYPFDLNVNYRTYPGEDVIETWVDVKNNEKGTVTLNRFMSGYLPVRYGNVWLSQLYGSWANEGKVSETPLNHGVRMIKNKDGARNSHTSHAEIMLSLDGKPQENTGRTVGAALEYSGNYKLFIDTDDSDYHHFFAGINEENSEYHLKKGESFVTPPLALTYSEEGLSGVSRNFHRWGRNHRLHAGNTERKVLLNSWEGVYFNITEPVMDGMMKDIADMGGELFVMDDGWFGKKYPRDNDSTTLGDWVVDTNKLPNGIQALIDSASTHGIKFGIWIEPEMTNTVSELYEKHPEYIIKAANRPATQGRGGTQLVLDLANPKVQDIVFTVVDTLMRKYPAIDYIKWDANAPIMDHGSQYLTADNQSHLYIDYHKGLAKVLDRIRAKYPDLTIQACASGGGRANYGVLPWFDEFWVSDNTDALQRVYMQWGASYFFPAVAMASHISATPNHQTYRSMPLKYRIDVAMSGRLGMEIQPRDMSEAEREQCRKVIAEYKEIRPVVQQGDIYRLQSPYEGLGVASLLYATPEKDKAVYFWWKTEAFRNQQLPRVKMAGLDPDRNYKVREINRIDNKPLRYEGKVFSGRYLMDNGLEMPVGYNVDKDKRTEWGSRVLLLTAE